MKILIAAGAMLAATIGMQAEALAQGKRQSAPVYRYCLMDNSFRGSAGSVLCRYETLAQCYASRNTLADTCYVNPEYSRR